jgi:hypothetical protein
VPFGLELTISLQVTLDDHTFEVTADGSRISADVGDLEFGRPTLRLGASALELARRLSEALAARSLTLTITRHGREIVELGAGVDGGSLARFLGVSRVRILRGPRR